MNDFKSFFISYNLGNISMDYINTNNPAQDMPFLVFSNSDNGLYCSKWIYSFENIIKTHKKEEILKRNKSNVFNNDNLADIQNISCLKILKNGEIYCLGTNNAKLKIVKLKDDYSNIELVQEINVKDDSTCINNIIDYNQNKNLIISDEKHIIAYEKNVDDNNYNTYAEKKVIDTGNKTYIIKLDEHNLAAFIYPNVIKLYNVDNYEFAEVAENVINEIKSDVNSNNKKQFKMMNILGENNNILGVCSNEHSIYLIDINEKKLIKNCLFEGYNDNFVSVLKFYDDYVFLLDSNNNLILAQVQFKEEKVNDLKFISLIKKLNSDSNMICYLLFEICYFYFDGKDIHIVNNSLEDDKENINVEIRQ
jgi:hypothetical protein